MMLINEESGYRWISRQYLIGKFSNHFLPSAFNSNLEKEKSQPKFDQISTTAVSNQKWIQKWFTFDIDFSWKFEHKLQTSCLRIKSNWISAPILNEGGGGSLGILFEFTYLPKWVEYCHEFSNWICLYFLVQIRWENFQIFSTATWHQKSVIENNLKNFYPNLDAKNGFRNWVEGNVTFLESFPA